MYMGFFPFICFSTYMNVSGPYAYSSLIYFNNDNGTRMIIGQYETMT